MHESSFANIDTRMRVFISRGIEEYEISWSGGFIANIFSFGAHFLNGARQFDVGRLLVNIAN